MAHFFDEVRAIVLNKGTKKEKIERLQKELKVTRYEAETFYDANGRIAFTINRSLIGVGVDRPTWENTLRQLKPGETYRKTYMDDTQPGGPVERMIEYVAPFDRCDREEDYETAWKFFREKYGERG